MMISFFLYRYLLWIFYILGIIGHLLNIYVFTRSCFRSNPCSLYFLASTLANLILVSIFIPLRIIQYGFNVDLQSSSLVFCKLSSFINDSLRILSFWFLILACIDRYWITSSNIGIRQLSTIINTRFIIYIFTIFIFFIHIHIIMFYRINDRIDKCIPRIGTYQIFDGIYRLLMIIIYPLLFMCIFGGLILNNIYEERKRITPFMIRLVYDHHLIRKKRQINNQIYSMLFVQCFIFIIMNIPFFINCIYVLLLTWKESNESLNEISWFISLVGHCITFYCFMLSSRFFRGEVIKFSKKIIHHRKRSIPDRIILENTVYEL